MVKDGIIGFGLADPFYEGHGFTSTGRHFPRNVVGRLGLYFARHHYIYEVSQAVAAGSVVIEIGCGGGSRYFASCYDMLGVDVSATSVRHAARVYSSVVQGTVAELPVADGCVDAIISSYVIEHLGDDVVDRCLAEMGRVLRPGGLMVHCFDVDGIGPFQQWARRQAWYQDIFVKSRGHFGLRSEEEWRGLFAKADFEIRARWLFCKTWLQDLSIWAALDDPMVTGLPRLLGRAAATTRRATGWAPDVIVTLIDDWLDRWLPDRWATKVIMRLQKLS